MGQVGLGCRDRQKGGVWLASVWDEHFVDFPPVDVVCSPRPNFSGESKLFEESGVGVGAYGCCWDTGFESGEDSLGVKRFDFSGGVSVFVGSDGNELAEALRVVDFEESNAVVVTVFCLNDSAGLLAVSDEVVAGSPLGWFCIGVFFGDGPTPGEFGL